MRNVVYDIVTGQIKGYDREPLPFELSIDIPYPISLQKTVKEPTGNMVQKVNEAGQLLYWMDVITPIGYGGYVEEDINTVETTDALTVTTWETRPVTYKTSTDQTTTEFQAVIQPDGTTVMEDVEVPVYDIITTSLEVPIAWNDHEPIIAEEVIVRTYTLEQNCYIFTADEVLNAIANTVPVKTVEEITAERVTMAEDALNVIMTMM